MKKFKLPIEYIERTRAKEETKLLELGRKLRYLESKVLTEEEKHIKEFDTSKELTFVERDIQYNKNDITINTKIKNNYNETLKEIETVITFETHINVIGDGQYE